MLHYWWPKISGRLYPEKLGQLAALIMFVSFNLTLFLAEIDLGKFNNDVALGVAGSKMLPVVLFFMPVRHEKSLTWIFVSAGLIWRLIMFGLTLVDYLTRSGPIYQVLGNRVG